MPELDQNDSLSPGKPLGKMFTARSRKLPVIYGWEFGTMFDAWVVRGYLSDGQEVTRQVLWLSHGQIGIAPQEITGRRVRGHYRLAGYPASVERAAAKQDG